MIFSFGQSERERIEVVMLSYEGHDWLTSEVTVYAGGFQGNFNASLVWGELAAFLNQLRPLYKTLRGTAEFSTLEGQIHLLLVGDGKGHIELTGELEDRPGLGNRLHINLHFDQTQLALSIHELERFMSEYSAR